MQPPDVRPDVEARWVQYRLAWRGWKEAFPNAKLPFESLISLWKAVELPNTRVWEKALNLVTLSQGGLREFLVTRSWDALDVSCLASTYAGGGYYTARFVTPGKQSGEFPEKELLWHGSCACTAFVRTLADKVTISVHVLTWLL